MSAAPVNPLPDEQFQAITRALADPRRFAILQQIAASGSCLACSALAQHEVISPATVSHHLKELSEAGLIRMERDGRASRLSFCRPTWDAYRERLAAL
jgi:ArsR family transcriptional regulator